MIVRHPVSDYATWRAVYDGEAVTSLHAKHGVKQSRVLQGPDDANDVVVINEFDTAEQAGALAADPDLKAVMTSGGLAGEPRIEIFASA